MSFRYSVTARFHEVDRAGIVFFGRVYEYAHICFEEMLHAAFDSPDSIFGELGFALPLVHSEASFSRPIRQGDRLEVAMEVEAVSARSITFAYRLYGQGRPEDLRAVVRLKHAFVSFPDFGPAQRSPVFDAGLARVGLLPTENLD